MAGPEIDADGGYTQFLASEPKRADTQAETEPEPPTEGIKP